MRLLEALKPGAFFSPPGSLSYFIRSAQQRTWIATVIAASPQCRARAGRDQIEQQPDPHPLSAGFFSGAGTKCSNGLSAQRECFAGMQWKGAAAGLT